MIHRRRRRGLSARPTANPFRRRHRARRRVNPMHGGAVAAINPRRRKRRAARKVAARANPKRRRRTVRRRIARTNPRRRRRTARANPHRRRARRNPWGPAMRAKYGSRLTSVGPTGQPGLAPKKKRKKSGTKASRSAAAKKGWARKRRAKKGTRTTAVTRRRKRRGPVAKTRSAAARKGWRRHKHRHLGARRLVARKMGKTKLVRKARRMARGRRKTRIGRARQRVARTYLRAKTMQRRRISGSLPRAAAADVKAYGLMKINNPSMLSVFTKDLPRIAPVALVAGGVAVGMSVVAYKIGAKIMTATAGKLPEVLHRNVVPLTALGLTGISWGALKSSRMLQKWSMPVLLGGAGATMLLALVYSKTGQKILQMVGFPITLVPPTATPAGKEAAAAGDQKTAQNGLGDYMAMQQYMGGFGDYVDAGPQNAFGGFGALGGNYHYAAEDTGLEGLGAYVPEHELPAHGPGYYGRSDLGAYVETDFPVHSPGPGDPYNVRATLAGDLYGQSGIFASGSMGAAYPPGGYGGLGAGGGFELVRTPGGTMMVPLGEAGIFGERRSL